MSTIEKAKSIYKKYLNHDIDIFKDHAYLLKVICRGYMVDAVFIYIGIFITLLSASFTVGIVLLNKGSWFIFFILTWLNVFTTRGTFRRKKQKKELIALSVEVLEVLIANEDEIVEDMNKEKADNKN